MSRRRTIKRTLIPLNLDLNEVPISTLNSISFPFSFGMTKDDFVDLMTNSGRYSEIICIDATPKKLSFQKNAIYKFRNDFF